MNNQDYWLVGSNGIGGVYICDERSLFSSGKAAEEEVFARRALYCKVTGCNHKNTTCTAKDIKRFPQILVK